MHASLNARPCHSAVGTRTTDGSSSLCQRALLNWTSIFRLADVTRFGQRVSVIISIKQVFDTTNTPPAEISLYVDSVLVDFDVENGTVLGTATTFSV